MAFMHDIEADLSVLDDKYNALKHEYVEFAYVVSHDLNAPIRQMRAFSNILVEELAEHITDEQKKYCEIIESSANRSEQALTALLEFSRLNTDEKHFEDIAMNDVLQETVKNLYAHIDRKDASVDIQSKLPTVYGDRKLLVRMFYYLIDNALKFQPEGQQPKVQIKAEEQGTNYVFSISDNGIGMDPKKLEDIFVIFRQLNPHDVYPGRGVGLTFAKKIAEIHQGNLRIETKLGEGTTVHVSIPQ